jgi:hypothetical protein
MKYHVAKIAGILTHLRCSEPIPYALGTLALVPHILQSFKLKLVHKRLYFWGLIIVTIERGCPVITTVIPGGKCLTSKIYSYDNTFK